MVSAPTLPLWSALDPKRIVANSAVIVLHAVALGVLMMPMQSEPRTSAQDVVIVPDILRPAPPPAAPLPPRQVVRQPTHATPRPTPDLAPPTPPVDEVIVDHGEQYVPPAPDTPVSNDQFDDVEPAVADLVVRQGTPPPYPLAPLRAGEQGTVILRILVDAQGLPTDVRIEKSSGVRALDQAALQHVRRTWRFVPAMRDGRAIPAIALLPIRFSLPE